jgi:hypothetical protein
VQSAANYRDTVILFLHILFVHYWQCTLRRLRWLPTAALLQQHEIEHSLINSSKTQVHGWPVQRHEAAIPFCVDVAGLKRFASTVAGSTNRAYT